MNPNLVWNGRFRLITHRPTHTPQLCVSQHLRCFQAGSFRLCVKKARTGNSVHCNRGPCLGQKSAPSPLPYTWGSLKPWWRNPTSTWLLLHSSWLVLKSSFLFCRSHTNVGKRHSGRSTPESPRAPVEDIWVSRHTRFQAAWQQQHKPLWGIFKQVGDFQMTDASHRSLKCFCAS